MKKIILISIISILFGCSKQNPAKTKPLLLNTKQIDYTVKIVDKELIRGAALNNGDKLYKSVESFDGMGNLIYQDYLQTGISNQHPKNIDSYYIKYIVENKHIDKAEYYDYQNKLVATQKYIYQGDKLIQIDKYLADKLDLTTTYKYNQDGDVANQLQKFADGRVFKNIDYKYNQQHQVIEESIKTLFRSVDKKINYTYNANGDITREDIVNPRDDEHIINTYQYKYDQYNNWIERIKYVDDKAILITVRINNYR